MSGMGIKLFHDLCRFIVFIFNRRDGAGKRQTIPLQEFFRNIHPIFPFITAR